MIPTQLGTSYIHVGRPAAFPTQLGTSYIHVGRPAAFPTQLGTSYIHVGRAQRGEQLGRIAVALSRDSISRAAISAQRNFFTCNSRAGLH